MKPKDFQEATAQRIVEIFEKEKQNRVLLADEVGLGKTIVARAVVGKVSAWHRKMGDKHFKVVYICSNINIANQNSKKLGIRDEDCLRVSESRLSMQHLKIYQNQGRGHGYQQLIPLTPATSFSMTGGCGNQEERALMFVLLRRLPAFQGLSGFSDFMRYYELKNWDYFVSLYEGQIVSCHENGSAYISVMTAALNQAITHDMILEIQAICNGAAPEDRWRSRDIINSLRRIFAQISLDKLEPDLVIMDEFQRFRDLIAPADDETGMLSKKFLHDSATKVLLLSATPYKPYSTLEEISQNESFDHYREFMQVMDFLLYDARKNAEFKSVWRDFSHSLSELNTDRLTVLYANKTNAESALYSSICRTERFRAGMIDASKAVELEKDRISKNDVLSFAEMQMFLNEYNIGNVPVDYVKSAPYLLSFMESYKLKENIVKQYKARPNPSLLKRYKTMLLRKSDLNAYKKVDSGNARLQYLMDTVFDGGKSGMEKLLWLPPSKPYYKPAGVFRSSENLSKVLVFSSWEMVPRMIASMLSYEAERLNCIKINENKENKPKRYFAADSLEAENKRKRRAVVVRLRDYAEKVVSYPCKKLSELYSPLEHLGCGLDAVQKDVAKKVQLLIQQIKDKHGLSEGRGSAKDYFNIMYRLFDGFEGETPSVIPHNAETVFTNIAIASPAVCAYRLFINDGQADALAESIVSLFNKTESMDILDVLYGKNDDFYYEDVLRYCAEGNLQAVLDEWAYVLAEKGNDLLDSMKGSFLGTASVQVDTYESFSNQSAKPRMRNHFAVGYFNARLDDKNVQRTENIRLAFNSPFRPFVLATTSIGQEGLDFHLYCRKICHWNLPSNPVDLEQREGRINRYLCLAIRQSIAQKYGNIEFHTDVWDEMVHAASEAEKQDLSDLVPFWCLPDDGSNIVKIERIVPMYPLSKDRLVYERLVKVLTLYRLTLGQPRQEELLDTIHAAELDDTVLDKLFINLSPYFRNGQDFVSEAIP